MEGTRGYYPTAAAWPFGGGFSLVRPWNGCATEKRGHMNLEMRGENSLMGIPSIPFLMAIQCWSCCIVAHLCGQRSENLDGQPALCLALPFVGGVLSDCWLDGASSAIAPGENPQLVVLHKAKHWRQSSVERGRLPCLNRKRSESHCWVISGRIKVAHRCRSFQSNSKTLGTIKPARPLSPSGGEGLRDTDNMNHLGRLLYDLSELKSPRWFDLCISGLGCSQYYRTANLSWLHPSIVSAKRSKLELHSTRAA